MLGKLLRIDERREAWRWKGHSFMNKKKDNRFRTHARSKATSVAMRRRLRMSLWLGALCGTLSLLWLADVRTSGLAAFLPHSHLAAAPTADHTLAARAAALGPLEPAVSNAMERRVADDLQAAVPELTELYIQPQRGGYALIATASVTGLQDTRLLAKDIASRYLTAAYDQLSGIKVDFAALYVEQDGRYVMAAGLGRAEADQLSIQTFAPDQGDELAAQLSHIDRYTQPLVDQAFAEYKSL